MRTPVIVLISTLCAAMAPGQAIEDAGPYAVGWRDVNFVDANYGRGRVEGRIYYPALSPGFQTEADPSSGPFPLVSFMHGWIQPASDYDEFCTHLSSWGFVVMSNNTELSLLFVTMQAQARDTRALMQWVEDESQDVQSWLSGMVDLGDWGTCGHSMGGGATSYLVREDSRVRFVVMFEPYLGLLLGNTSVGYNAFDDFTGDVIVVGADMDLTNNWFFDVWPWYQQAEQSQRRVWGLIHGGDHFGCTDWAGTNGFLSGPEQHRMHRRFGTGFLRAEMKGEEDVYYELLGNGSSGNPESHEAAGFDPPLWSFPNPVQTTEILVGSFGNENARLRVAAARSTGSLQTPWGELGLDSVSLRTILDVPVAADGIFEESIPPNPALSGATLWFQALLNDGPNGTLSRTVSVVVP